MTDKCWKKFERRICRLFGGRRRGADYGDRQGGKSDCITPGWSIECKVWERPTFQTMLSDAIKAEERRENPLDIPIAIMKKKGARDENALVSMRLKTFLDYFGGGVVGRTDSGEGDWDGSSGTLDMAEDVTED